MLFSNDLHLINELSKDAKASGGKYMLKVKDKSYELLCWTMHFTFQHVQSRQ